MWPDDSSTNFQALFNGSPMGGIQGIIEGYMGQPDDAMTRARMMADIEAMDNDRPPRGGDFNQDPNSLKFKFDLMSLIFRSDIVHVLLNAHTPEHTTFGSLTRESLRKEIVINYRDTARSSRLTLDPVLNMIPAHLQEEALSHAFAAFIDALADVAREGPMAFVDKSDPKPKETDKPNVPHKGKIDLDLDF